ncbi:helix-turn-helix domain-containing protein [Shinella curvata]|uniref:helix-turn-helix domain-containing protein n=1 Tax=Shinella curvata TaxID=1817964 RepID=UPI003CC7F09F
MAGLLVLINNAQYDNYYHQLGTRQALFIKVSDFNHILGRQIAAARALLGIGQVELADRARISAPTLRRMEASEGIASGLANNVAAVRAALESAGILFIDQNGNGPGVRLRDRQG